MTGAGMGRSTPPRGVSRGAGPCLVAAWLSAAGAASPELREILPPGVQRGTEAVLTLRGARLEDAIDLLLPGEGVALGKLEASSGGEVKAAVRIAPDCRLGEHSLRVRTRSGITELRTFRVGALPGVQENEPNGEFAKPQEVPLDVTVSGVVAGEDVDYYAFRATKGQRVTAEVEAIRLGRTVFDAYVAILNSARFELASCDDSALLRQDPVASAVIPEDGTYVVEVREASYGGSDQCLYRLHLGTFPRPLAVVPAGGKAGQEVEVAFLGDAAGEIREKVRLPEAPTPAYALFSGDGTGTAPSPNAFRVSAFENVLEAEPNDSREQATGGAAAPCALNGILSRPGDEDWFRVACKKGQQLDVQVWGRRLRSPIDSVLAIADSKGQTLQTNDDAAGPDSAVRFSAPEDGEYWFRVGDHLGKGGPLSVYRVEISGVEPRVVLAFPRVAQFSQERQTVCVPRGNRYAAVVSVSRSEFGGDLVIAPSGLPDGVAAAEVAVPGGAGEAVVLFEAAPDAPLSGRFFDLGARAADPAVSVPVAFAQEIDLVVGAPGQSVYCQHVADRPAIAVTEEAPFRLTIVEPGVPIVRNGTLGLKVVAERAGEFKAPIRIQLATQPPGVSSDRNVSIPEGAAEAVIAMNAGSGAPPGERRICVQGAADAGKGTVWVASQIVTLRVAESPFTLAVDRGAVEQGKSTRVLCKVAQKEPFEGTARVELLGLPPRVTAAPLEVTKDSAELAAEIAADPESPVGNHKGVFCRISLDRGGESIVWSSGGTELRIDPPPPEKPPESAPAQVAAAPPPPPEAPKPPPERPLTRLEKLRLEAQKAPNPAGAGEVQP